MPQYPVPQFIESEGKIVAFLTYRQFFELVAAGGLCFAMFFFLPFLYFVFGTLITLTVFGIIAFYKVDNMSVIKILTNLAGYTVASKNYTWKKKEASYPLKVREHYQIKSLPQAPEAKMQHASKLKEVQKMVDTKQ